MSTRQIKVKYFGNPDSGEAEKQLNDWLAHYAYKVVDIKFQDIYTDNVWTSFLVIYEYTETDRVADELFG